MEKYTMRVRIARGLARLTIWVSGSGWIPYAITKYWLIDIEAIPEEVMGIPDDAITVLEANIDDYTELDNLEALWNMAEADELEQAKMKDLRDKWNRLKELQ